MANLLDELALKYGTEKGSQGHHYTAPYFWLLAPLRDRELRIVEIGVATGASLRMWEEFFPRARIFAIEKDPAGLRHASERCRVLIGDQSDAAFLRRVVAEAAPLDLVIDDGSHHPDHQLASLEALFPALRDGGIYVIEDLACCFSPRYGPAAGLGNPRSTIEYLKRALDVIHATPGFGGRVGDSITSRLRAIHFFPQIAFLVTGAPNGAPSGPDLRVRAKPRTPVLASARARWRYRVYRLGRAFRRLRRQVTRVR